MKGLLDVFPPWLFKYLFPIYIFLYWLVWTILIMMLFKGAPNDRITSCINDVSSDWVLYIGGVVDVFNTILFLVLFIYPIYKSYQMNQESFDNNSYTKQFQTMIRYNIILSTICSIASFIHLFLLASFPEYLRLFEQVDMSINQIAVGFMLASNRHYIKTKFNRYCACLCCNHNNKDKKRRNVKNKKGHHDKVMSKSSMSMATTTISSGSAPNRSDAVQVSINTIAEDVSAVDPSIVVGSLSTVNTAQVSTTFE